ncbi:hypothetical protein IH601_03745 [Candidatus Bipolaricaulota bacterium]|nr:hypothetical protein [Candidatus Bipolaricaulota bacterium]
MLAGLMVFILALSAVCSDPAQMGSGFAEVYGSFAPLVVLHRSYADYLFYGTDVVVPEGVASACDETGYQLALLHLELLSQTGSQVLATLPRLTRLRADVASYCDAYSEILTSIALVEDIDMAILEDASERGMFSAIYALQQGLQFAFEAYLEGIAGERGMWEFAVAFALKTVLDQEEMSQLDEGLRGILYGSEQADAPPAFLPQDVADGIAALVEFLGSPIASEMEGQIRALIQLVYDYVMEEA